MPDSTTVPADDQPTELTIELRKPISSPGGDPITSIKLREPTAGEWAQWDKLSGVEADMKAVSVIAGVPERAVQQLGVRDLGEASRFIGRFFAPPLATEAGS